MLGRLFLAFTLVTLVELWLLVKLAAAVSLPVTIGLVVLTGFAGAWLAKREGLRVLASIQSELAAGRVPGGPIIDGLCVLVAGAFLLTPGILTDIAGFALLIPFARAPIRAAVSRWFRNQVDAGRVHFIGGPGAGFGAPGAGMGGFGGFAPPPGERIGAPRAPRGTADDPDVIDV